MKRLPLRLLVCTALVGGGVQLLALPSEAAPPNHAPSNKTFEIGLTVTTPDGTSSMSGPSVTLLPSTSGYHFQFSLTNDASSSQAFGSARLTPPPGLTIEDLTPDVAPTVNTADYPNFSVAVDASGALLVTSSGPTGTGVLPGGKPLIVTATVDTATAACPPSWGVEVKQSNDFSGSGNGFNDASPAITTPVGQNKLVFTTQPSATQYQNKPPMTPSPVIGAVDACGNAIALTDTVTVGDTLDELANGGGPLTPASGVVTLTNLTFGGFGIYDELTASNPAFVSATSVPFSVAETLNTCTSAGPCPQLQLGDDTTETSALVTTGSGSTGDYVSGSVNSSDNSFGDCTTQEGGVQQIGDTVTVDSPRSKTVTMTLPKSIVNALPTPNGTPFWDICLSIPPDLRVTTNKFVDKAGHKVWEGLLPDCVNVGNAPPCIDSRKKNAGNEIITFTLPPGDPHTSWY